MARTLPKTFKYLPTQDDIESYSELMVDFFERERTTPLKMNSAEMDHHMFASGFWRGVWYALNVKGKGK